MPSITAHSILADAGIHPYGSPELAQFETYMARYFGREYCRWQQRDTMPEAYGISSFEGRMTEAVTRLHLLEQHYDSEREVFRAFLDTDYMAYTMAYYGHTRDDVMAAALSLEQAQRNKFQLVVERAQIEDGQNILDLGCGFGGFSKYLFERLPNITVTAVNPSLVQTNHIRDCIQRTDHPLHTSRFSLIQAFLDEINHSNLQNRAFDRVIGLGLLEHISNLDALFHQVAKLLAPDGKAFQHCIVSVPTIPQLLDSANTLIGVYFPGGHVWPYSEPARHQQHLELVDSWFVNGLNYWRTLDSWHKRFWDSIDILFPKYLSSSQVDQWNKYFSLCKAMFIPRDGTLYGNGQYLYEC